MTLEGINPEALASRIMEGTVHSGPATSQRRSLREDADPTPPSPGLKPKSPACLLPHPADIGFVAF